ncbi:YkgJ family cysteine cluster protein [Streptomyces sp. NPDC096080]|uniref:YkgJ family cysteine cluster protein n=1 Tax=Streptomyces sp. NPDC096080 TaxID=3156693 RepID=UPI003318B699
MSGSAAALAGCASCKGRCCREYTVNVTMDDVRGLATGMALHPREFLALQEKDDGDFRFRRDGPRYDIRLRHRPDTEGCVFLMEIAPGHARCGAYAHRPRVCANFPASLSRNTVAIRDNTLCGDADSWNLTAMDLPGLRANILRNRAAWTEHLRLAERWNAHVDSSHRTRSHDELYDFILEPGTIGLPDEDAEAVEAGARTASDAHVPDGTDGAGAPDAGGDEVTGDAGDDGDAGGPEGAGSAPVAAGGSGGGTAPASV